MSAATTRPIAACRGSACSAPWATTTTARTRYTADKIDSYDFRGNVGIVLMDFAAASHATMTYGQTYSNMQVYGDDLVRAVICNNNKWNLRRNE